MIIFKAFFVGLIAVYACFALSISGKVTDTSGVPIAGASVRLEINGQTAISRIDGKFILGDVAIKDQFPQSKQCRFSVRKTNGFLLVDLKEKTYVDVITYTLQGRAISTIRKSMDVGLNSIALPYYSSGVFLYKVKSGNTEFMVKSNSVGQFSQEKAVLEKNSVLNNSLAKQMKVTTAINDVIAVTKDGYLDYRCVMYNSDTSAVEIKMIVCADTVRDIDGNLYHAVRIGNQVWTVENLRTTKYNDGTAIPKVIDSVTWCNLYKNNSPAYCYFDNMTNADSIKKYGALYNWYVVNTANSIKVAPAGWHVPTYQEWFTLWNYLIANGYNWDGSTTGPQRVGKSLAAKTDWENWKETIGIEGIVGNDLGKNNRTGFSALPGGFRSGHNKNDGKSVFSVGGQHGKWWSGTEYDADVARGSALCSGCDDLLVGEGRNKDDGSSVRLVRDN